MGILFLGRHHPVDFLQCYEKSLEVDVQISAKTSAWPNMTTGR